MFPPPSSSSPSGIPSNEFLNNVNPAFLSLGVETTSNLLKKQRDIYMPGVSIFWNSLKIYFMVNNNYVLTKLKLLLFPFTTTAWARFPAEGSYEIDDNSNSHKWLPPRHDMNAPDLYIPLMSFITYALLVGYVKGTHNNFTPEVLIQAVWSCLLIQMIEIGVIKIGLSMLQTTLPFLDLFSYTGYKYTGLCITSLSRIFGSTFYFLASIYTSVAIAYFVLKTMAASVTPANQLPPGVPPRHLVLLGFALMQFLVNLLLCYI